MKNNFKIISLIVLMIFASIFNISSKSKKKPPKYLYKIASEAPDGSIWVTSIKQISRELYKKTKGELGIRVYPGSIMGDQSTVIKKIMIGQLSGCTFSSGGLALIYKDSAVMGFPMVFRNYEEYDYTKGKMSAFFEKEFEKKGYILLGWTEVGLIYLYSKKKVNTIETFRDSKPFLYEGDTISLALFKESGTTPIPLQMSDIMTGLQTGLIDTIFSSPYALIVTQWFTKVKYMADIPITLMIGAIMVDKKLFYSMPREYQKEMKKTFHTTFNNLNERIRKDNDNALVSLKKNGLIILPVNQSSKQVFYDVCNRVADKLTEKDYSKKLLERIRGHVEEFREKK